MSDDRFFDRGIGCITLMGRADRDMAEQLKNLLGGQWAHWTLWKCTRCGALVETEDMKLHKQWHEGLSESPSEERARRHPAGRTVQRDVAQRAKRGRKERSAARGEAEGDRAWPTTGVDP
jgi:hypothetical protein